MSELELRENIKSAFFAFSNGIFDQDATGLLATLGYKSDKHFPQSSYSYENFLATFDVEKRINDEKALVSDWKDICPLFQITADEIKAGSQLTLDFGKSKKFDKARIESYLFFAIDLIGAYYTRGQLASITREINKLFPMPVMILFRHGTSLTFAIIDRRINKKDDSRDVLEKVTLIKDIDFSEPHRAHIEILADLSLEALYRESRFASFLDLHEAWRKVLDTSVLNKRFYKQIANWYYWAQQEVTFPSGIGKGEAERNSISLLRLITRLIFVWFMKEKKLVPDELFNKLYLDRMLNYKDQAESTYYKAILQNLFFGTLNTEMGTRAFRHQSRVPGQRSDDYMSHNRYRYERFFWQKEIFLDLCSTVPFLNGGLFECLDESEDERVDGFSDREDNVLKVPDYLFFGKEIFIDLNEIYGTHNQVYSVSGLVDILSSYKFTVAENTPIEEEIALDPELLGKVFENLLAAYNPETGITARKQTGSFYTPREIVNYMVDESLVAYLEAQLKSKVPKLTQMKDLLELLRQILAYTEKSHPFNNDEALALIDAIDSLRVIDPACGSGAFPMGMLHKLVFVLGKLDPNNIRWRQLQVARANKLADIKEREDELADIEQVFSDAPDYARKLYLIEYCLYGVDIQPIAVQIAKLRCFISLIVDDRPDKSLPNRGIRPLPNLETKFVAANSLVSIERPSQLRLGDSDMIREKERELAEVRRHHFLARTTQRKDKWRNEDKRLRDEIENILAKNDFPPESAKRLAQWDPYEPGKHADFFDPEWMFALPSGFDIVIGNPPYLRVQGIQLTQPEYMQYYLDHYKSAERNFDLYALFIERGYELLNAKGQFAYIVPHKFFQASFGAALRALLTRKRALRQIVRFGSAQVFAESTTYTCLLFLSAQPSQGFDLFEVKTLDQGEEVLQAARQRKSHPDYSHEYCTAPSIGQDGHTADWDFSIGEDVSIMRRLVQHPIKLASLVRKIFQGLATSYDAIYVLEVLHEHNEGYLCYSKHLGEEVEIEAGLVKPFLMGKDVHHYEPPNPRCVVIFPYHIENGQARLMTQNHISLHFPLGWAYLTRNKEVLVQREHGRFANDWHAFSRPQNLTEFATPKIMTPEIAFGCQMTIDKEGIYYHTTKVYSFAFNPDIGLSLKYLLGILNSKVLWYFLCNTGYVLRGGYRTFKTDYLKPFPIAESRPEQEKSIETLVDYVLHLKALARPEDMNASAERRVMTAYFEQLIDAMVYELYFPEEFIEPNKSPSRLLTVEELPALNKLGSDKYAGLIELYQKLYANNHPVRSMLFFLDTIKTIKVIEEKSRPQ